MVPISENGPLRPSGGRRVPVSFTEQNTGPTTPVLLQLLTKVLDENAELPSGNAYSTIDDVFRFTEVLRGRGTAHGRRSCLPCSSTTRAVRRPPSACAMRRWCIPPCGLHQRK
ncbi:hypothetical protein [Marinitenerispora sediminis]|uniref:hypothetical protein n=1 Tax=Marinitenerispora sediminis TaxID=1931232 RepID=UPI0011C0703A|nr:hypothetical protein [Marinitenerispora sediminis]